MNESLIVKHLITEDITSKAISQLSNHGIDVNTLKKKAKKLASNAARKVKNMNDVGKASKIVQGYIKEVKNVFKDLFKNTNLKDVIEGFVLSFVVLLFIAFFAQAFIATLVSAKTASLLTLIFIMPFVEEYFKRIYIKNDKGGSFVLGFMSAETLTYVVMAIFSGISIPAVLISRTSADFMHLVTAGIQQKFKDKDNKWYEDKGFITAVILHSIWNAISLSGFAIVL